MSRARKISTDLRHVATLAGTTAAVVEGAAIAAEKAKSVTDHLSADHGADSGPTVDVAEVAKCRGKKKLFVLLLILVRPPYAGADALAGGCEPVPPGRVFAKTDPAKPPRLLWKAGIMELD